MKKLIITLIIVLVLVLITAVAGLLHVRKQLKDFPSFEIKAEQTALGNDEIFGWIEQIVSFGPRKPAMEGDTKTRAFISEKFAEFGLKLAKAESVPVETSQVRDWSFSLKDPKTGEEIDVPTFHIPFPAPTPRDEVEAELVYVGEDSDLEDKDVRGKIVVFEQPAESQNWASFRKLFFFYDPADSIPEDYSPRNMETRRERGIHDKAVAGGAVGMVGLLSQLQWESDAFCPQMNHGVSKRIPGYWVSPRNAVVVKKWLERGPVLAKMKMDSELGYSITENIWAILPGETDEYYVVMCHHDAPFANAVQDASGVSVVLALAKHFSQIWQERPLKRGIIFLAVGGHTLGRLGESIFVKYHKNDILPKTALVVSIEHIGKEFVPREDLAFKCSDQPTPRMVMTSRNENINGIVKSCIIHNDYQRSVIIPQWLVKQTTGKARGISGELYEAGAPAVGLLPNPPYMFFKEDTLETVARDQLVPTTNLVISILRTADTLPLEEVR